MGLCVTLRDMADRRNHRSLKWQDVKKETNDLIKTAKKDYYEEAVAKLKSEGSSQLPYRVLKELAVPNRPSPWSINSLRPGLADEELAEELADYFVKITDEFPPLTAGCHPTS